MLFPIVPVADRVVVLPTPPPEKTKSGLWIPQTAATPADAMSGRSKAVEGVVMALGPGKVLGGTLTGTDLVGDVFAGGVLIPPDLEVGQTVYYGPFVGTPVEAEGVQYLIIREAEVMLKKPLP